MAAERRASVTWKGNLIEGSGTLHSFGSGALGDLPVTWASRAEESNGKTSPEELLAGAHASCYSMRLSSLLAKERGVDAERLDVTATVTFVPGTGITTSALHVRGAVPGISAEDFVATAEHAKATCPVSEALAGNVEVTLDAALV
jgi:osmotically inducible protein OsmC